MALHMTAGTVPESRLIEGETAAASKAIRETSSDSMVKAVMRDRDQKLFAGTGNNKAYLFDEFAENLAITLSDFNPVYAPFFDFTPNPAVQYSPTANAKVYIVLFKTTEGVAKDWVKDAGAEGQDGRRSFLVLMFRCKPVTIQSLAITKSNIRGITINGKKSPETSIKMLISYGRNLRAADSYSDFQIASDIMGALGTDYSLLVTTLNTANRDKPGVLTTAYVKEAVLEFYEDNYKSFSSAAAKADDSAAAAQASAAALTKGGVKGKGGDKGGKGGDKGKKDPPDCTACGEGKHWFKDCPLLKGLREKRGAAPSTPAAAPVTTPSGSAAAVEAQAVAAVPSASAAAAPPLDEKRYGPCTDDFSSDDEEVMCPIDFSSDEEVMCPVDFSSSSEDEEEVLFREPVGYAADVCAVEQSSLEVPTVQKFMVRGAESLALQPSCMVIALSLILLILSAVCFTVGAPGLLLQFMVPLTTVAATAGRADALSQFMIDCGATVHMTRNRSAYTRFTKQHKQMRFKVAADTQGVSQGIGDVAIPVWNHVSESMEVIQLTGVYYCPQQPFDLISMDRMMEDLGYDNPDFRGLTWGTLDGTAKHSLVKTGRLYYFKCESNCSEVTAPATEEKTPSGVRNTENWGFIKSEVKKWAPMYGNPATGKFDVDLFTCGGGEIEGNAVASEYCSVNDSPFKPNFFWIKKHFYANPPFSSAMLFKTFEKSVKDFNRSPEDTTHFIVAPVIKTATWWHFTKYFQVVHIYPVGSKIFTATKEGLFNVDNLEPAGVEANEGEERYFVEGTQFEVALFYRDRYTPVRVDDHILAHLRYGHYSAQHIVKLKEHGIETGLTLNSSVLRKCLPPCTCSICLRAKMRRPGPFKVNDNKTKNEPLGIFQFMVSDATGPISPPSTDGMSYAVHFTCVKSRWTFLYFCCTKDQIVFCWVQCLKDIRAMGYETECILLQSDNAQEYYAGLFAEVCKNEKVQRRFISAYMHEENAAAEVAWRDIGNGARAIMLACSLPMNYWPLAWRHFNFIKNRMPNSRNDWQIPYSIVKGVDYQMDKLRIFGSDAFVWIDPALRKKLDSKSKRYVYVGHAENSTAFLCLDVDKGKVIRKGQPTIVENFNDAGQKMGDSELPDRLMLDFETELMTRPRPYYDDVTEVTDLLILEHRGWYDDDDKETYALIKVHDPKSKRHKDYWIPLSTYLSHDASGRNFDAFTDYMSAYMLKGNHNYYYPLYVPVLTRPANFTEHYRSIIVSTDANSSRQYGVCFDPVSSEGCSPEDVEMSQVDFEQEKVMCPAKASPTRKRVSFTPLPGSKGAGGAKSPSRHGVRGFDLLRQMFSLMFTILGTAGDVAKVPFAVAPAVEGKTTLTNVAKPYLEPATYMQALSGPDAAFWKEAMVSEVDSLLANGVWRYEEPPWNSSAPVDLVDCRVVLKRKLNPDGSIDKYKVRITARGCFQTFGVSYEDIFAPTSQVVSIRLIFLLSLYYGLKLRHLDVATAFLNSPLKYDIWIKLPPGLTGPKGEKYAKLLKSLYGLKQAGKDWYDMQDEFMTGVDSRMKKSSIEPCLYYINSGDLVVLVLVYVDDYVCATNSPEWYEMFVAKFKATFKVNELGEVKNMLQMGVNHTDAGIELCQERQIHDLAARIGLTNATTKDTPMSENLQLPRDTEADPAILTLYRSVIGCLLWIARTTRPDIMFAVIYLAQFCSCATDLHLGHAKRVVRYLLGTASHVLLLKKPTDEDFSLTCFTDSDWAGDHNTRKSVSGYVLFGPNRSILDWGSSKQNSVTLSSYEAEYVAASEGGKQLIGMRQTAGEILKKDITSSLEMDNQGALFLAKNDVNNKRSKHIHIRFHALRDWVKKKLFGIFYVPTAWNTADIMTKALGRDAFERHRTGCGVEARASTTVSG